jgi:RNA polymerase sigma factor (sigma-70 family)
VGRELSIPEEASDAVVIERSFSDPRSFAVIFDRHFDAVHAYLATRVGEGRADDLAASAFAIAFERRRRFRREASTARPWLFGIAANLLRNEWRAEKRSLEMLGRLSRSVGGSTSSEPGDALGVGEMLAELDRDQREVLLLYAWEELSYEEIAAALGIPVGTVRSRLSRARAQLRVALGGASAKTAVTEVHE